MIFRKGDTVKLEMLKDYDFYSINFRADCNKLKKTFIIYEDFDTQSNKTFLKVTGKGIATYYFVNFSSFNITLYNEDLPEELFKI